MAPFEVICVLVCFVKDFKHKSLLEPALDNEAKVTGKVNGESSA